MRSTFADAKHKLNVAELYYVTAPMATLAASAARSLPPTVDLTDPLNYPADCGLMYFEGGLGWLSEEIRKGPTAAYGAMWIRRPNGLALNILTVEPDRTIELEPDFMEMPYATPAVLLADLDRGEIEQELLGGDIFPSDEDWQEYVAQHRRDADAELRVIAAILLMAQPVLVETSRVEGPGLRLRSVGRERPMEPVTIIFLRRALHTASAVSDEDIGQKLQHRFVVRGHWKAQPCGPGLTERKTIYVNPYWKGPDGAPILIREIVNVWRR